MDKELMQEARNYIINGVIAYGVAFGLLEEDEVDQEWAQQISYGLEAVEALIPSLKALYELDKKMNGIDDSFLDWLATHLDKFTNK